MKKIFVIIMTILIPSIVCCQSEMKFKKIITTTQKNEQVKLAEGHIYVEDNEASLTVFTQTTNKKFYLKLIQSIDNQVFVYESFKNNNEYLITINFVENTTQISQINNGIVVEREMYPWTSICLYINE